MAAPCVQDTCSITSAIDAVTRQLQLDARLDPQGGLQCTEGVGLGVAIYEDPGTAGALADACLNGLRRTGGGELIATPKRAQIGTGSGTVQGVALTGAESATSFTLNTTNPYDCAVLGLLVGRFEMTYRIDDDGPFNADMRCRLLRDGGAVAATYMDIGGDLTGLAGGANSVKRRYDYFAEIVTIGAGASYTWTSTANHEGANEDLNITTSGTEGSTDLGFRAVLDVIHLPFNSEAL
jgi:hypothetical protein